MPRSSCSSRAISRGSRAIYWSRPTGAPGRSLRSGSSTSILLFHATESAAVHPREQGWARGRRDFPRTLVFLVVLDGPSRVFLVGVHGDLVDLLLDASTHFRAGDGFRFCGTFDFVKEFGAERAEGRFEDGQDALRA